MEDVLSIINSSVYMFQLLPWFSPESGDKCSRGSTFTFSLKAIRNTSQGNTKKNSQNLNQRKNDQVNFWITFVTPKLSKLNTNLELREFRITSGCNLHQNHPPPHVVVRPEKKLLKVCINQLSVDVFQSYRNAFPFFQEQWKIKAGKAFITNKLGKRQTYRLCT